MYAHEDGADIDRIYPSRRKVATSPLRRSTILLVGTTRHDPQQRRLQRLRLIPWRAQPNVPFLVSHHDHRYRLGMDRLDNGVRRRRQEAVDIGAPESLRGV
jgi:hypothetical protein